MKLAINIDYIIRDWETALINTYKKQIDPTWDKTIIDRKNLWEIFEFPIYKFSSESTFDHEITESVVYVDESKTPEPNEEYFNKFMYDNILEIFGHAKEASKNIMLFVNKLYYQGIKNDTEITLYSKTGAKGRAATLFFLSKYSCEVANIKFIKYYDELSTCDYILYKKNDEIILKDNIENNKIILDKIEDLYDVLYK